MDKNPSPEVLVKCIKDGYCWWCGKSFISLGVHTYRKHNISASELREMAGLYKNTPTCIPDYSASCRKRNLSMPNNGITPRTKNKGGYKVNYSTAGRIYQHTVRAACLLTNSNDNTRRLANKHAADATRKPHPCPICGKLLSTSKPITCSTKCLKIIRQRTLVIAQETRRRLCREDKEYKKRLSNAMSKGARRRYAEGNNIRIGILKPHPCPVCGTIIPKATPRYCSAQCSKNKST